MYYRREELPCTMPALQKKEEEHPPLKVPEISPLPPEKNPDPDKIIKEPKEPEVRPGPQPEVLPGPKE